VLPAFGEFIDHDTIEPEPNDSVFIIANAEVVPIALPKIAGMVRADGNYPTSSKPEHSHIERE
jgi:hypothetical protein